MQVMPATAKSLGIKKRSDPEQSLRGGTDYLDWLDENFADVSDSLTRVKFVLAGYNCGYGHMKDAQRLASEEGLDPTQWDGHVEKMILALSSPENFNKPIIKYGYVRGSEPVNYVKEIFERYDRYKQLIPLD